MSFEHNNKVPGPIPQYLRRFHLAGSLTGFVFWLFAGFKAGLEFGAYGGRLLANDLVPDDIKFVTLQHIVTSIGTFLGILLGFLCSLSFFLVIGAICGDLLGRVYKKAFGSGGGKG